LIEATVERYMDARSEQVWMLVDNTDCRARWLTLAAQIESVNVVEPVRRVEWTHSQEHLRLDCTTVINVDLIPDGAGTRVRIVSTQVAAGPLQVIAMRFGGQRSLERELRRSLEQLAEMIKGRTGA
jgi:carbon monoxide dehydrogenase subunit G